MKRAFTFVELLVATAIIAGLAALLLPVFGRVRQGAFETTTRSDLRQSWLALALYREEVGDLPNSLGAARYATRAVPTCQHGNPWALTTELMPSPTLGHYGYVRLISKYQARENWEAHFPENHRYILASIRYANPLPLKFEGEAPADPDRLLGTSTDRRFAYPMPQRVLVVHDQGSVRQVDRRTESRRGSITVTARLMSWPNLFDWVAGELGAR